MVWYGMVWYGILWYGMVWYGVVVVAALAAQQGFRYVQPGDGHCADDLLCVCACVLLVRRSLVLHTGASALYRNGGFTNTGIEQDYYGQSRVYLFSWVLPDGVCPMHIATMPDAHCYAAIGCWTRICVRTPHSPLTYQHTAAATPATPTNMYTNTHTHTHFLSLARARSLSLCLCLLWLSLCPCLSLCDSAPSLTNTLFAVLVCVMKDLGGMRLPWNMMAIELEEHK